MHACYLWLYCVSFTLAWEAWVHRVLVHGAPMKFLSWIHILYIFQFDLSLKVKVDTRAPVYQIIFPRHCFMYTGEGTFGLVRQARAEGIVESTPERNIVAVKTTRGKLENDLKNYRR